MTCEIKQCLVNRDLLNTVFVALCKIFPSSSNRNVVAVLKMETLNPRVTITTVSAILFVEGTWTGLEIKVGS